MTFEERLAFKQKSGYDKIENKEEVLKRKESAGKAASTKTIKLSKKMYDIPTQ